MENVRTEIAKNLKLQRTRHGLTQKKLAELLGVKNSAVSNWEQGLNSIDIDTLHAVCKVFKITVNDMFGEFANMQAEILPPLQQKVVAVMDNLNIEGQEKVLEHAELLLDSGKYIKTSENNMVETA